VEPSSWARDRRTLRNTWPTLRGEVQKAEALHYRELLMSSVLLRRKIRFLSTRWRELRMIAKGLLSTNHPLHVHLIPVRRCNLSCAYCSEFDNYSKPVPPELRLRRSDRLDAL